MNATPGTTPTTFVTNLLQELERASGGGSWWTTSTATVIVNVAQSGPLILALAGIAQALRDGDDPEWVVGGASPLAAFAVANEWIDAGINPAEVNGWLRAGCWDPKAARSMVDVGLRPAHLLNDAGEPAHWIEATNGERMSVALAVADAFMTVEKAMRVVTRS